MPEDVAELCKDKRIPKQSQAAVIKYMNEKLFSPDSIVDQKRVLKLESATLCQFRDDDGSTIWSKYPEIKGESKPATLHIPCVFYGDRWVYIVVYLSPKAGRCSVFYKDPCYPYQGAAESEGFLPKALQAIFTKLFIELGYQVDFPENRAPSYLQADNVSGGFIVAKMIVDNVLGNKMRDMVYTSDAFYLRREELDQVASQAYSMAEVPPDMRDYIARNGGVIEVLRAYLEEPKGWNIQMRYGTRMSPDIAPVMPDGIDVAKYEKLFSPVAAAAAQKPTGLVQPSSVWKSSAPMFHVAARASQLSPLLEEPSSLLSAAAHMFHHAGAFAPPLKRKGLVDADEILTQLSGLFPGFLENWLPGEALDDGDCFFDSLAQILNGMHATDVNTAKYLRMQCHDFYLKNKNLVDSWNQEDHGGLDKNKEDYYFVQHTAEELKGTLGEEFASRSPIWGRPIVEGRILCRQLKLPAIHVIEVLEDPETKKPVLSFHEVTKDRYRSITEVQAKGLIDNPEIPTLIVSQGGLHFVPLMAPSKLIELAAPDMPRRTSAAR